MKKLTEQALSALEMAKKAGAGQARVRAVRSRFWEAEYKDGELNLATASTSAGLEITLFVDGRYGVHSTNDPRPEALASFVERAAELTRLLSPDKDRALPEPGRMASPPGPELGVFDPELAGSDPDSWPELAGRMDGLARKARKDGDPKLVATQGGAHAEHSSVVLADSRGLLAGREETGAFFGAAAVYLEPGQDQKRRMGWWWEGARDLAGAEDRARHEAMAQKARQRALEQMGAEPGPSGVFQLLLENQAAGQLISRLLGAISGPALKQKRSYLAGRAGQKIASPLFCLADDPFIPGGFGSRWFDAEGVAPKPMDLAAKGVLRNFYLDSYHARALGLSPTTGGQSNITMTPSTQEGLEGLSRRVERGLLATGFMGGNFNSTTGDFSFGVKGMWLKGGKAQGPVEGMNISGNLEELLLSLQAVGADPYPFSALRTPSLLFERANLSGR